MAEPSVPATTFEEQADAAKATIARLEEQLRKTPATRPLDQGVLRYRLGLAYQEMPVGDHVINLSRAIASLQKAASLFDPARHPGEHGRTQNALGAALREIGQREEAVTAFKRATELIERDATPGEHGAALNNLGLALTDLGRLDEAVTVLERALDAFSTPELVRQRMATLLNLGQALAAHEEPDHVSRALLRFDEALELADPDEHPYQWALLHHSKGVAYTGIAEPQLAVDAFRQSLRVFTRQRFPFQYALAKNNLGLAHAQLGDVMNLRSAVGAFEDALRVLDTRLQKEQWEQAFRNLELAEDALEKAGEEGTRADHFVRTAAAEPPARAADALRDRLVEYTLLPDPRRTDALAELDLAMLRLPDEHARALTAGWLEVLMELPQEQFAAGLNARVVAHDSLDPASRARAEAILDHAIQNGLLAPQRIRVRDTLYELGYERPPGESAGPVAPHG